MKADFHVRINEDFNYKPYFYCHWYRGIDAAFGWLWFMFNINIWSTK